MKRLLSLCLVALLLCAGVENLRAGDHAIGVGVAGSAFKFYGDPNGSAALSTWAGPALRYGLGSVAMLEFNVAYGSFKPAKTGSLFKDPNAPFRTFCFPVTLSLRIAPFRMQRWNPYLAVGAGLLFWDLRNVGGGDKQTFWSELKFRWGERVSFWRKNALFSGGLGAEYFLTEKLSLDLQGRLSALWRLQADNLGYGAFKDQIVEAKATVSYYLRAPRKAEETVQMIAQIDRAAAEQGPPQTTLVEDRDSDGIPDDRDRAPLLSEDLDGFQDEDGIPDPDNDQDGILDVDDKCPNEAETVNGFEDEDGCPDTAPTAAAASQEPLAAVPVKPANAEQPPAALPERGAMLILRGVNFSSGSAMLTPESYAVLDQVIAGLRVHSNVHVEIQGHTDSSGSDSLNLELSQYRAEAVRQYLISQGIAPGRLSAVGKGEEIPIARNDTAEGRAANRRIEFHRVN